MDRRDAKGSSRAARRLGRIAWVAALALQAHAAAAAPAGRIELSDLRVLEDAGGIETIESVGAAAARFRPLESGNLAAGYTRAVHWIRFDVAAPSGEWWLDVLPPYLDDLRLYEPDQAQPGRWIERRAGDRLPFPAREVAYRGFVFRLQVPAGLPSRYYLRVRSSSTLMVLPRLWAPAAFHAAVPAEYSLLLACVAALLIVAALSVHAWILLRDRVLRAFALYLTVLSVSFIGVGGFAAQYLAPAHPVVTDAWVGVGTMASVAAFAAWLRELFRAVPGSRFFHGGGILVAGLALAGVVAIPLGWYVELARATSAGGLLLCLAAGGVVLADWQGARARGPYHPAVLTLFLATMAGTLLGLLGLLPGSPLLLYAPNLAGVVSVVLLHLSISGRYRRLDEDRRSAEQEADRQRGARERQERFLDLVTHEFRTPLSTLRANLDILRLTRDEGDRGRSLDRLEAAAGRLAEVFDGHLRGGAAGEARLLTREPLDPLAVLRQTIDRSPGPEVAGAAAVTLRGAVGAQVLADGRLLSTVFLNLLENARKYGPAGGQVDVDVKDGPGAVVIRFANDVARPPGVPSEALGQRGLRGANGQGVAGMGMGLHLCRKLLEDQGGTLALEVSPGGRFVAQVTLVRAEGRGAHDG